MRGPESKILSVDEAVAWRRGLREKSLRLGMTNGCYDLLHRGHIKYLYRARERADALLVAVNSDASIRVIKGESRPIMGELDRAFLLAALAPVDAVVVFGTAEQTDVRPLIGSLAPDVYIKGGDYTVETINQDERRLLESLGARIEFVDLIQGISTSEVVRRIAQAHGGRQDRAMKGG
jgi:rfaE bifunctional protein nucleotidyltransferase chain/domain